MSAVSIEEARGILGGDLLSPEDARATFGTLGGDPAAAIPFDRAVLTNATRTGEMLVYRSANLATGTKLTLAHMIDAFPAAFEAKFLTKMGYQLKDEWGISLEPLTTTETCTQGWALVSKDLLDPTRNLAYEEQSPLVHALGAYRRRLAVEVVYDTILYWKVRDQRLLARSWDWTSSRTIDGGYLNVGGFGDQGMQLFSYSRAVRHGALGVCPTRP